MIFYYLIIYLAVLLAATGQVLLKHGSVGGGLDIYVIRLNIWVVVGLGAMSIAMLLIIRGLSVVPLRDMAFILPTGYIAVPLLSKAFLKERLKSRTVIGTLIIIAGIFIFNIPTN